MVSATLLVAGCCDPQIVVKPLPIPAERLDCRAFDPAERPALPPEYVIDWNEVETIQDAYDEHRLFVDSVRKREGRIAVYVVEVEGALWACASDDLWLTEWQAGAAE